MALKAKTEKVSLLNEVEAKILLEEHGLPVVQARLARTRQEAVAIAGHLGFPVAMKIISPDIPHKSDAGGVKLGLTSATRAGKAFRDIVASVRQKAPRARIGGVSVQKMARPGTELIIGVSHDPQFGPMIMFGLGGVLVEILKDVSFRLIPLSRRDASEMVQEIKGYPILKGYRGHEEVNIPALEDFLLKVSSFIANNPQIRELDMNPVFGYRDGLVAADARIILEQ